MKSAVTVCLVPEARSGPFVFHGDLERACSRAAELGYDAVELFPPDADAIDPRSLRQILHRNRLQLAAVGSGAGWVARKLSLTDADSAVRHRAQQFIAALVDFAGAFGAPVILGSMQGRAEGAVSRDQALTWLAAALEQLGPRAHAQGVPFLLEPLNRYESNLFNTLQQALHVTGALRTRNVRLLADLFHMNIEEASIPDALRTAGDQLGHVHLADSNRSAAGLGHTDLATVVNTLRDIGYTGFLSAEVFPRPDSDAAAAQGIRAFRSLTARTGDSPS